MSLKTLIGTAIISLGVAGIIFVAQNSAPSLNQTANESKNNNLVSDKPFIEAINGDPTSNLQNGQSENLTETFTKNLTGKLQWVNSNGPVNFDGKKALAAPDPDAIAEELISEAAQKFDPQNLKPVIKESDLNISEDNEADSLTNYFKNLQKIMLESGTLITSDLTKGEVGSDELNQFINMYGSAYKKFIALSVPSSLVSIHKKELQLLGAKLTTYNAIKNYEQDPLLSVLAAQNLTQLDNEFADLSKEMSDFIKNHKLEF